MDLQGSELSVSLLLAPSHVLPADCPVAWVSVSIPSLYAMTAITSYLSEPYSTGSEGKWSLLKSLCNVSVIYKLCFLKVDVLQIQVLRKSYRSTLSKILCINIASPSPPGHGGLVVIKEHPHVYHGILFRIISALTLASEECWHLLNNWVSMIRIMLHLTVGFAMY